MIEPNSSRAAPLQPDDPHHIGDYELIGRLGVGGMGVVFLARSRSGRLVAVKLVHAQLASDGDFRSRFRGEVERAQQVPPFCTAEVLDADPDADQPYLVVEYVDGPTLGEEVKQRGPLSAANLHAVAIGVATALAAIHEAGVIHRDLKPGNVLLAPGSPKVIDFGIARAMEPSAVQLTRTGQIFGTVNFMAPERFGEPGVPLTSAADIFAWGCVVAFAGTGRAPFEADSPMATMARILTQPPALDGLEDGPLRGLVERALVSDPAQRPTARELLDLLLGNSSGVALGRQLEMRTATVDPVPSAVARQSGKRPRRTTGILVGAVLVLVLALAGGAGFIYRDASLVDTAATGPVGPAVPDSSPSVAGNSPEVRPPATARESSAPVAPPHSRTPSKASKAPTPVRKNQPAIKAADSGGVTGFGPYFIRNLATGMCVDLPGAGPGTAEQVVSQAACVKTGDDNQEWTFVRHGADPNGNQLYQIKNADDGRCLDVPGTGVVPGGQEVAERDCLDKDNQEFRLAPRLTSQGWQYYRLVNAVSGMCLDVLGAGDGGTGAVLTLVGCATGDDHEWALVEKPEW